MSAASWTPPSPTLLLCFLLSANQYCSGFLGEVQYAYEFDQVSGLGESSGPIWHDEERGFLETWNDPHIKVLSHRAQEAPSQAPKDDFCQGIHLEHLPNHFMPKHPPGHFSSPPITHTPSFPSTYHQSAGQAPSSMPGLGIEHEKFGGLGKSQYLSNFSVGERARKEHVFLPPNSNLDNLTSHSPQKLPNIRCMGLVSESWDLPDEIEMDDIWNALEADAFLESSENYLVPGESYHNLPHSCQTDTRTSHMPQENSSDIPLDSFFDFEPDELPGQVFLGSSASVCSLTLGKRKRATNELGPQSSFRELEAQFRDSKNLQTRNSVLASHLHPSNHMLEQTPSASDPIGWLGDDEVVSHNVVSAIDPRSRNHLVIQPEWEIDVLHALKEGRSPYLGSLFRIALVYLKDNHKKEIALKHFYPLKFVEFMVQKTQPEMEEEFYLMDTRLRNFLALCRQEEIYRDEEFFNRFRSKSQATHVQNQNLGSILDQACKSPEVQRWICGDSVTAEEVHIYFSSLRDIRQGSSWNESQKLALEWSERLCHIFMAYVKMINLIVRAPPNMPSSAAEALDLQLEAWRYFKRLWDHILGLKDLSADPAIYPETSQNLAREKLLEELKQEFGRKKGRMNLLASTWKVLKLFFGVHRPKLMNGPSLNHPMDLHFKDFFNYLMGSTFELIRSRYQLLDPEVPGLHLPPGSVAFNPDYAPSELLATPRKLSKPLDARVFGRILSRGVAINALAEDQQRLKNDLSRAIHDRQSPYRYSLFKIVQNRLHSDDPEGKNVRGFESTNFISFLARDLKFDSQQDFYFRQGDLDTYIRGGLKTRYSHSKSMKEVEEPEIKGSNGRFNRRIQVIHRNCIELEFKKWVTGGKILHKQVSDFFDSLRGKAPVTTNSSFLEWLESGLDVLLAYLRAIGFTIREAPTITEEEALELQQKGWLSFQEIWLEVFEIKRVPLSSDPNNPNAATHMLGERSQLIEELRLETRRSYNRHLMMSLMWKFVFIIIQEHRETLSKKVLAQNGYISGFKEFYNKLMGATVEVIKQALDNQVSMPT